MDKEKHFWFSQEQLGIIIGLARNNPEKKLCRNYAKINGKVIEYTTCTKSKKHGCMHDDMIYLGKGIFSYSESIL